MSLNEDKIKKEVDRCIAKIMRRIAHQWRQPLAQINATVTTIDNILYKKNIDDPHLEAKLLEIEHLTKYMSQTIEDFKEGLNNQEAKHDTKLVSLLQSAIDVVDGAFKHNNIEIIQEFHDDYECKCSAKKLKQIILVLLNNAKDAHRIRNTFNAKVYISLKEIDNVYVIAINDNAGGVTKSVQEKMFEPHYTTKHSSEGTGMGLFMAKTIIEQEYQGSLDVRNVDEGTCFSIHLPKGKYE